MHPRKASLSISLIDFGISIAVRSEHPAKANSGIDFTSLPMKIFFNVFGKALAQYWQFSALKYKVSRPVQVLNARASIEVTDLGISIVRNFSQSVKLLFINVTELPIESSFNSDMPNIVPDKLRPKYSVSIRQFKKGPPFEESCINNSVSGPSSIIKSFSAAHSLKADAPIVVTDLGIFYYC